MIPILMMSAKFATLGLFKIKVFWKKGYNVIISARDVTNRFLSRDSNYIAHAIMWSKIGNSKISVKETIITWIS